MGVVQNMANLLRRFSLSLSALYTSLSRYNQEMLQEISMYVSAWMVLAIQAIAYIEIHCVLAELGNDIINSLEIVPMYR